MKISKVRNIEVKKPTMTAKTVLKNLIYYSLKNYLHKGNNHISHYDSYDRSYKTRDLE